MARDAQVLQKALQKIRAMRAEFWENVNVLGDGADFNQALEHVGRVAERRSLRASITATSLHGSTPARMHGRIKESLGFEYVKLSQRSYK
jgi:succinate dehydrogenase / fumarate reductase, flavoprotein subunit